MNIGTIFFIFNIYTLCVNIIGVKNSCTVSY